MTGMTDSRIMALRLAGKICPAAGGLAGTARTPDHLMGTTPHNPMEKCNQCEAIAEVLELYAKEQTIELRTEIRDMKDVGRAKAKMVAEMGYTEASAHRYLQKTAMDTRRPMGDLARDILKGIANGS